MLKECRIKSPYGKHTLIWLKFEIRSDVLSIVDTFEFASNGINNCSQLRIEPGELLSFTSPAMSGRTKLTKAESVWKSTLRVRVFSSHRCEAVDVSFSVVMTSLLRVREHRRHDTARGELRVRWESYYGAST